MRPDLDAAASVWAVRRFVSGYANAPVVFYPANWNGEGMAADDIAVDIEAGGRGIKGKIRNGRVMSAFATILEEAALPAALLALGYLVRFIDLADSQGLAIRRLTRGLPHEDVATLSVTSLGSVFAALKTALKDDSLVCDRFGEILDGMLANQLSYQRAGSELDSAEILPGGRVAILRDAKETATIGRLFSSRGVWVVVYSNGEGLGVLRDAKRDTFSVNTEKVRAVIEEAGETAEWFFHSAGFLVCRGSRKNPVTTPSKVDPRRLAEAIDASLPPPRA